MAQEGSTGRFRVGTILMRGGVEIRTGAGAPTNGTSGTGAGKSGPGSLYLDYTNKSIYQNTNTLASPLWNAIGGTAAITREDLGMPVINKSGSTIAVDKLVALAGLDATSGKPKIVLADADVAAHDDVWVTTAAIADQAEGTVTAGALSAATLNTNSVSSAGDPVYLDVTAGGFAVATPTGATARVIPVGFVVVKSATVGQILWSISPTRAVGTNELQAKAVTGPKIALADTHLLVGDSGGAAADVALSGDATLADTGVLTIANAAVSLAKMANLATDTVIGRDTAGTGVPEAISAASLLTMLGAVAGVAAGYKVARGVASITGSGTVVTGLTTVVAVDATASSDLDGDALAGVSATIGDQAGTPAAGSVILKAWKVTTGGAAGNPTLIAASAAKSINWIAIGT